MASTFDFDGIHFLYPENWKLERQDSEDGWTVMVQSPETAFILLTVNQALPTTEEVLATALETLRADYPDLEADASMDAIAGQPTLGHDIRFTSLDLTNVCWTRSFYSPAGTVLVLCQCSDYENEINEKVLRAICASMQVEE